MATEPKTYGFKVCYHAGAQIGRYPHLSQALRNAETAARDGRTVNVYPMIDNFRSGLRVAQFGPERDGGAHTSA